MTFAIGMLNELCARFKTLDESSSFLVAMPAKAASSSTRESAPQTDQKAQQYDELIKCIEIHKRIKNLSTRISKQFGTMFFVQDFLSSLVLCVSAYSLSLVRDYLIHLVFRFIFSLNQIAISLSILPPSGKESDSSGIFQFLSFMMPTTLVTFLPYYCGNELSVASERI